jgi:ATP adenylyltransferase/5',5'''-P-1,P-4-tetraphosphate phosphorylase II
LAERARLLCSVSADELQNASNAVFEAMGASTIGEGVHSYNVLLTHDYIIYVPRSRESSGPAGVNALVRCCDTNVALLC